MWLYTVPYKTYIYEYVVAIWRPALLSVTTKSPGLATVIFLASRLIKSFLSILRQSDNVFVQLFGVKSVAFTYYFG